MTLQNDYIPSITLNCIIFYSKDGELVKKKVPRKAAREENQIKLVTDVK